MESGGGIRQFERDEKPPFGGESPGFINLVLREQIAKFAWTPRTTQAKNRGIPFHGAILQGNLRSVTSPGEAILCQTSFGSRRHLLSRSRSATPAGKCTSSRARSWHTPPRHRPLGRPVKRPVHPASSSDLAVPAGRGGPSTVDLPLYLSTQRPLKHDRNADRRVGQKDRGKAEVGSGKDSRYLFCSVQ